jgi:uncharacterized membrane-anchored protein
MGAPLALSHLVMVGDAATREASRAHLCALLRDHHLPQPHAHDTHLRLDVGGVRLRWELHTEFVSWTFSRAFDAAGFGEQEPAAAWQAVPQEWLAGLPGQCLAALNLWVLPGPPVHQPALVRHVLREDSLVGASVADGQGAVFTDFALHADGYSRMVLLADGMSPRRLGRLVQRLLEIDTYRMTALLGLPAARESAALLGVAEAELAALAGAIRAAGRDEEPQLLDRLTRLAGQVESHSRRARPTSSWWTSACTTSTRPACPGCRRWANSSSGACRPRAPPASGRCGGRTRCRSGSRASATCCAPAWRSSSSKAARAC